MAIVPGGDRGSVRQGDPIRAWEWKGKRQVTSGLYRFSPALPEAYIFLGKDPGLEISRRWESSLLVRTLKVLWGNGGGPACWGNRN